MLRLQRDQSQVSTRRAQAQNQPGEGAGGLVSKSTSREDLGSCGDFNRSGTRDFVTRGR